MRLGSSKSNLGGFFPENVLVKRVSIPKEYLCLNEKYQFASAG